MYSALEILDEFSTLTGSFESENNPESSQVIDKFISAVELASFIMGPADALRSLVSQCILYGMYLEKRQLEELKTIAELTKIFELPEKG